MAAEERKGAEPAREDGTTVSRRGFVYGLGGIAATLAVGAGARATVGEETLLFPPTGQQVRLFQALCIRCDRCRSACPTGVIGVAKIEDGLLNMRLPKMEFRLSYCDACDGAYKCIEACPTGALALFDPAKDKIGMAVINEDKCQVFGTSATCGKTCMNYCPAEAIVDTDDGYIAVDQDLCWGCGACEYVCPTNSYHTYDGDPSRGINVEVWNGGE